MAELDFSPLQNLAGQAMGLSREANNMRNDQFRNDLALKSFELQQKSQQMNETSQNIQNKIATEQLTKLQQDNALEDVDGIFAKLPFGPQTKDWLKERAAISGIINENNMTRIGQKKEFIKTLLTDKESAKQLGQVIISDTKAVRDKLRQLAALPEKERAKASKQLDIQSMFPNYKNDPKFVQIMANSEDVLPDLVNYAEEKYNQVMTVYDRGEQAEKIWKSIPDADQQLYMRFGVNPNVSDPIALQMQIQKVAPEVEKAKLDFMKKEAEAKHIEKSEASTEIEKLIAKRDKLPEGDSRRKPFDDRIAKLTHIPKSDKSGIKPDAALKRISAIDEKIAKVKTGEISEMQAILMQMIPEKDRSQFKSGKTLSEDDKAKVIDALEREKAFLNSNIPEEYRQTKELDEETASKIFIEAGRDKEKARELAKKRGYTF